MNLDIYTNEMSKSVWDKAFFMDKIPGVKYVIDFGCADGAMIQYLAPLFPDIKFIGYDINPELISRARSKSPFYANTIFFDSIEYVISYMKMSPEALSEEICLNFSSVLHEVFSSTGGVDDIQTLIDNLHPRFITIRDMYDDENLYMDDKLMFKIIDKVDYTEYHQKEVDDFVAAYGSLDTWHNMTHFLMKLQWVRNGWEEELRENYYSWTIDNLLDLFENQYNVCFECRYQLPYLTEKWEKDYEFYNPDAHTHAQFILRRDD